MTDKVYVVGLTGPTGSGKGEVSRLWQGYHFAVIDADAVARVIVEPGQPALAALVEEFTDDILNEDGSLNRRQLAKRAFATPQDTEKLNAITHPHILDHIHRLLMRCEQRQEQVAVIDAPLLFESGLDRVCDAIVAVVAPAEVRQERIRARDGLTEEQARARMAAQPSEDFYTARADVVLYNNGRLEHLQQQAAALADHIREWSR